MTLTVIFQFTLRISSVSQPEAIVADKERHQLWLPSPAPASLSPPDNLGSDLPRAFPQCKEQRSHEYKVGAGGEIIYLAENTGAGRGGDTTELAVMRNLQHIWWENVSPSIHLFPRSSQLYIATANFLELGTRTTQTSHRINTWTPQQPLLIAPESFAETFCLYILVRSWVCLSEAERRDSYSNIHFLHFMNSNCGQMYQDRNCLKSALNEWRMNAGGVVDGDSVDV